MTTTVVRISVRELCELILEAKGLKDQLLAKYTA